jgi:uncharacterized protein YwgA
MFATYVLDSLKEQNLSTDPALVGLVNNLKNAHVAEDEALKVSTKNTKSDAIREADAQRDAAYTSIKQVLNSYKKFPDEAHSTPANELLQLFKSYGITGNMQLDRETGMLVNLVTDLETKYAAQVKTLGIEVFVSNLKQANNLVHTLLVSRDKENAQVVVGSLRSARTAVDKAYHDIVKMINALVLTEGEAKYASFISYLNSGITRYKRQVLGQKSTATGNGSTGGDEKPGDGGNTGGDEKPGDGGNTGGGNEDGGNTGGGNEGGSETYG